MGKSSEDESSRDSNDTHSGCMLSLNLEGYERFNPIIASAL